MPRGFLCSGQNKAERGGAVLRHLFLPRCMECRRGLAMRILSARLSNKRVHCDITTERSVQIFLSYERSFSLIFSEEERLVGQPLLSEIVSQPAPVGEKSLILNR